MSPALGMLLAAVALVVIAWLTVLFLDWKDRL